MSTPPPPETPLPPPEPPEMPDFAPSWDDIPLPEEDFYTAPEFEYPPEMEEPPAPSSPARESPGAERVRAAETLQQVREILAERHQIWEPGHPMLYQVYQAVARHGPLEEVDPALLRLLVENRAAPALLENPRVGPATRRKAITLLVDLFLDHARRKTSVLHEWPAQSLAAFAGGGEFRMVSEEGERLLEAYRRGEMDLKPGKKGPVVMAALTQVVCADPETPVEVLRLLASSLEGTSERLRQLAGHPQADPSIWARLLRAPWSEENLVHLASLPQVRTHPEMRPALLEFGRFASAPVLAHLVREAGAREFATLFAQMAAQDLAVAAAALREARAEQLVEIREEDLVPLLQSPESETRMAAIAASSRLLERKGGNAPQGATPPRLRSLS